MIRRTCPAALFLLTLSGCGSEVSELEGSLLCSDLSIQGEDDRVDFTAAVLELDPEGLDCSRGLSLETDSGEVITLGYTLLDAAGEDMSPGSIWSLETASAASFGRRWSGGRSRRCTWRTRRAWWRPWMRAPGAAASRRGSSPSA